MSDIQMTSDEARDIGKVLELVEKINKLLGPHESWLEFPLRVDSELVEGIAGTIDVHNSGALVFKSLEHREYQTLTEQHCIETESG